MFPTNMAEW